MPLYEYECDACGHHFEAIAQKFSDPPPAACPKCGGTVHKMQSAPAFHLKGTGWYATDYAKKDQPTSAKSDSEKKESAGEKAEKAEKSGEKAEKKDAGGEKTDAAPKAEKAAGNSDKSEKTSGDTESAPSPKPKA